MLTIPSLELLRERIKMPVMTRAVPSSCKGVMGSVNIQNPKNKVETGPTIPACEALLAPIRATAIIVKKTGNTVHSVALIKDKPQTGRVWLKRVEKGRNTAYWRRQAIQETDIASATSRKVPTRCKSSPENTR